MIMNVGQDKEIYRICVDESKDELKTFKNFIEKVLSSFKC